MVINLGRSSNYNKLAEIFLSKKQNKLSLDILD
jgi:hypothetical protein